MFCETAHGFRGGVRQLYEEFYKRWRSISDVKVGLKSLKLTLTGTCKKSKNNRLVVNKDLVAKFGLSELDNDSPDNGTASFSAKLLPDDVFPDLIKVAHGTSSTNQVITEFLDQMKDSKFGKAQVKRTLRTIAVFDHVHCFWLVKPEHLREYNLEELNKKIKIEEKTVKEKKETLKKDLKEATEGDGTVSTRGKDQNSRNDLGLDSNSHDSETSDTKGKENATKGSTPKSMSIKKFFSTSSKGSSSSSTPSTPTTTDTPKAKKRIQLTTLSRTATMKQNCLPQPVLNPEEVMVIDEDE